MAPYLPFTIYNLLFLVLFGFIINKNKAEYSNKLVLRVFLYGALGWILAFLRIIIIQLIQIFILVQAGIDVFSISNEELVKLSIVYSYLFNIWGPLLAGIFEEGVRYIIISQTIIRTDRKTLPLIFGLGWEFGEILILSSFNASSSEFGGVFYLISVYERLIVSILQVSLTYLVIYAYFESNKISLWIAMFIHFIVDFILIVYTIELREFHLNNLLMSSLILEGIVTILTLLSAWWIIKHWRPNKESLIAV